jgi:hypothetical protein
MKTIEYRTIDKSTWGPGEWQDEPDKVQWQDEATGLPCLAVRQGRSGHWCGYVAVAEGHPYFLIDWDRCFLRPACEDYYCDHCPASVVTVHGGLNFAALCGPEAEESGVCHTVDAGEPDHVWWLGFDCAHSGDHCPARGDARDLLVRRSKWETYKPLSYVKFQVASLAIQLKAAHP